MNLKIVNKFISCLFFLFNSTLICSTFYVDRINGNDSNSGTLSHPFKTISFAFEKLSPGDTLQIFEGNYKLEGNIYLKKSGLEDKPIIIKAYRSGNVIVERISLINISWVKLIGLTVIGNKKLPLGWKDMPNVIIDNPEIIIDLNLDWEERLQLILEKYNSYSVFNDFGTSDTSWQAIYTQGFYLESCKNISLEENNISFHTVGIELAKESQFISIKNNIIRYCLDAIYGAVPSIFSNYSYSNCLISNNLILQTFREAIRLTGDAKNNIIEKNIIKFTGHSHITSFGAAGNNLIQFNTVKYGGYYSETMRLPGSSGISIHTGGENNIVNANLITDQKDITLRDGNGIIVDYTPEGVLVSNNIIYNVMGAGVNSVESGNSTIIHNTIVNAGKNTTSNKNGMAIKILGLNDNKNIIANNIFLYCKNGGVFTERGNLDHQKKVDYNIYWFDYGVPLVANGIEFTDLFYDLSSLIDFGIDSNSINLDPLIVDTTSFDFSVSFSSPAVNSGTNAYSTEFDFYNNIRPNKPTIGAIEYLNATAVDTEQISLDFILFQNFPNPFNPSTSIEYTLPSSEFVTVKVHDILGNEVATLVNKQKQAGTYRINFDSNNLASGIYIYKIQAGSFTQVKKMILLK